MQRTAKKYFENYAHPDVQDWYRPFAELLFDDCVVVPIRNESQSFESTLNSLKLAASGRRVLAILVVNSSVDSGEHISLDNLNLILNLAGRSAIQQPVSHVKSGDLDICILNRSISPFFLPLKTGVGLARKMGGDLAAWIAHRGKIRSPWIYSTDADVQLPDDYFSGVQDLDAQSIVFPFTHEPTSDDIHAKLATKIYDLFLHYYPAGLKFSKSPYAFPTIGSCLAFRWDTYIKVRGFPVLEAGEDFYFLNKASKLGKVAEARTKPIRLSGRLSDRVPFGTGPSIRKNILSLKSGREIEFYDPEIFWVLKSLLASLEVFSKNRKIAHWRELLLQDERRGLWTLRVCEEMGLPEALESLAMRNAKATVLHQAIHIWFDGFRTLKFIHRIRDLYLPSIPWFEAIKSAPFETTGLLNTRLVPKSQRGGRDLAQ